MRRSQALITKADLMKLLRLAKSDIKLFFERNQLYIHSYQGNEVLVALCQGAAKHYIDRENGVKDFDVWFFYPKEELTLPYRRRGVVDFGPSKFGRHPDAAEEYTGRTVDVLMRADAAFNKKSAEEGIVKYLSKPKTKTARLLRQKAVIGLYPEHVFGKVLWPKDL